jgi:DNA-binding MarR family transcriptional regulator
VAADDVPWLTPEQLRAWLALNALTEVLPSAVDAQLKRDAGINRFEYQVMAGLSESPGRTIRMSVLATFASGSLSRLSHALTRLESHGWVVRRPSADDPRAVEAVLTDAGWAKVQETAPGHVREARRLVVDVLSPAQTAQLERICMKLLDAVGPDQADLLRSMPLRAADD